MWLFCNLLQFEQYSYSVSLGWCNSSWYFCSSFLINHEKLAAFRLYWRCAVSHISGCPEKSRAILDLRAFPSLPLFILTCIRGKNLLWGFVTLIILLLIQFSSLCGFFWIDCPWIVNGKLVVIVKIIEELMLIWHIYFPGYRCCRLERLPSVCQTDCCCRFWSWLFLEYHSYCPSLFKVNEWKAWRQLW